MAAAARGDAQRRGGWRPGGVGVVVVGGEIGGASGIGGKDLWEIWGF